MFIMLYAIMSPDFTRDSMTVIAAQRPSTYSASIVATLKGRIIAWHYPPEHRLTEDGLCREFGVSRSPVREALRVLATNGFVRRMDNRGYAVRQVKVKELEELYDVRLALELFAVEALATAGAPDGGLTALAETWKGVRQRPKRKVQELAELDARFHEHLAALVGNETLLLQLKAINERLFVFRMIDFEATDRVKNTCNQHLTILDRIEARDANGAREALRRNIGDGRNIVGKSIKEALARAYGQ
jgi:DNA-binding GntR family transcriptional regulator